MSYLQAVNVHYITTTQQCTRHAIFRNGCAPHVMEELTATVTITVT